MTHFDHAPDDAARSNAHALARRIPLWSALLDVQDGEQLYSIFETTVTANGWAAALPPAWRAYGHQVFAMANADQLTGPDADYAREFFDATLEMDTAVSPTRTAEQRAEARRNLEAAQLIRIAQAATAPLPLVQPPPFAARLPTAFLDRDRMQLVLMPRAAGRGYPPLIEAIVRVHPAGFAIDLLPCDGRGRPLPSASAIHHSPGMTPIQLLWVDLGLGESGPYCEVRDRDTGDFAPSLGSSFEIRFVAGDDRAVALLCSAHDAVRIELSDCGDRMRFAVSCASAPTPAPVELLYADLAPKAAPAARFG